MIVMKVMVMRMIMIVIANITTIIITPQPPPYQNS